MGNCLRRPSSKDKKFHQIITKSKNDKYFTFTPFDPNTLEFPTINKVNLESMLQQLSLEKSHFQSLLPLSAPSSSTIQKLIVEVQKGMFLQKRSCTEYPDIFIRVTLHPNGPSFDTPGNNKELPSWFYILEIMHDIKSFKKIEFSAFRTRKNKDSKFLASVNLDLLEFENQKVSVGWFKMKGERVRKRSPRILVRIQWVFDESLLVRNMIEECSLKMQSIEENMMGQQISIN